MDALKNILAQKKQVAQKYGQVVKRADIEKEREENYWKQQVEIDKKKEEKKQQHFDDIEKYQSNPYKKLKKDETKESGEQQEKKEDEQPPISKEEVIKKLRQLGAPVTFFGETDQQRYKRLRKQEVDASDNNNTGGNVFDRILKMNDEDFKKKQMEQTDLIDEEKIKKLFQRLTEPQQDEGEKKVHNNKKQSEIEIEKVKSISNDVKHDDILVWSQKTLRDWELKLEKRFVTEEEKKSYQAKRLIGTYRQTTEYLRPFFKLLKDKKCSQEILDGLYIIIHYSLQREYVKANDKYLALAIGNAAWPMGVTMVGIHERAGRSKIYSSQVAHILNDETTRKYLQSMKRLVTVQQLLYPAEDKAKMINFDTALEELF